MAAAAAAAPGSTFGNHSRQNNHTINKEERERAEICNQILATADSETIEAYRLTHTLRQPAVYT